MVERCRLDGRPGLLTHRRSTSRATDSRSVTRNAFQLGTDSGFSITGAVVLLLGVEAAAVGIARLTGSAAPRLLPAWHPHHRGEVGSRLQRRNRHRRCTADRTNPGPCATRQGGGSARHSLSGLRPLRRPGWSSHRCCRRCCALTRRGGLTGAENSETPRPKGGESRFG